MHKFKSASAFRAFRAAAVLACAALLALPAAADFVYKAELTVSGYSGTTTLQNFPVLVRLSPDRISGFDYSLCQSDGKDIQFTSPDGETVYPHEIDTWNTDGESLIWVNVAELSGTETKIMFWFGNAEITEMPASSAAWCTANGSGYYGVVWHFAETIDAAAAPTTLSADSAKHATDKDMDAEPMKGTYGDMSVMVSCPAVIGNGRVNAITTTYNTGTGLNAAPCYGDTIGSDKALSFSGWYVLDAKSSLQHYLAQEYNSFVIQTGGSCNDILVDCGSGVQVVSANAIKAVGVVPAEGEWFHLAVTFLGAEVRIYVNGELVGSGTTAKALHYPYTSIKTRGLGVTLGNGRGSQHYALKGSYDEVRILSNVASADWVKAEYETATEDDYLTYGAATRASSGDSLVITADSAELGGGALSPAYGTINEFSGPLQLTALSADVAVSNNLKIAFVGWELYRLNSGGAWDLVDQGEGTSYNYVHQEGTNDRFVWKYVRKRPLTLAVYPEAAGLFSVEGAAVGPGTVWLTNQTTLAVGAVPGAAYDFLYWGGAHDGETAQTLNIPFTSEDGASLLAKFISNGEGHDPVTVGSAGASGLLWSNPASWVGGVLPQAKDTVLITNGALVVNETVPRFAKIVVSNATLTVSNWLTRVQANEIVVKKGGVVRTVGGIFDGEERNRVWLSGVTLTVEEGGSICADDAGYACNAGPAWAEIKARAAAGDKTASIAREACGAYGGEYTGQPVANPPVPYGSAAEPEDLGSGCGEIQGNNVIRTRGVAGGAVRLDFTGDVVINGRVSASATATRNYTIGTGNQRGSGGSVWINCRTISGNGSVAADGGDPLTLYAYMCGSGGRVAVHYDTAAQDAEGCNVAFSARGGLASDQIGVTAIVPGVSPKFAAYARSGEDEAFVASGGTIWFPDNRFLTSSNYQSRGLPFSGQWVSPVSLATLTIDGGLTLTNVMVQLPTGVTVTVKGDLDVAGSGYYPRRNCGIIFNSSDVHVEGDVRVTAARVEMRGGTLTVDGGVFESAIAPTSSNHANSRFLGGELAIKAVGEPDVNGYGAYLNIAGTLQISTNCCVCPFADPVTGSFVKMRAGNVVLASGGRINADEKGWRMWRGPGVPSTTYSVGASHAGLGGSYQESADIPPTYGSESSPRELGSGGGSAHVHAGFDGGGLVDLEVAGTFVLDGIVSADGSTWMTALYASGSSGGSVIIYAHRLTGTTGRIRAQGGCTRSSGESSGQFAYGSTGGGGRIAVYTDILTWTEEMQAGNAIVAPGCEKGAPENTFGATAGTVFWGRWHKGLMLIVR